MKHLKYIRNLALLLALLVPLLQMSVHAAPLSHPATRVTPSSTEMTTRDVVTTSSTDVEKQPNAFGRLLNWLVASIPHYDMPTIRIETTVDVHENVPVVPLINQMDYPDVKYGKYGTIASHGCGLTSLTMVASYLKDEMQDPIELAQKFGKYNTAGGSSWALFTASAKALGLETPTQTYDTKEVMEALANGQLVISSQRTGLFTNGGHFILLTGLTQDGKILVNDPNGHNYTKSDVLMEGFENGFTEHQIFSNGTSYWIYAPKDLNITDPEDERLEYSYTVVVE